MQHLQIREYERSIEQSWDDFKDDLKDNFSLGAVVALSGKKGFSISAGDWNGYFENLQLSKSKVKYSHPKNDNEITELSEVELDYVVGGVAAVPVTAAVIVIYTVAAIVVSVAASAAIVVSVAASLYSHVTVWTTGPNPNIIDENPILDPTNPILP